MTKCLYCYKELNKGEVDFHQKCVKTFFGSSNPPILPYKLSEIEQLAKESAMLSITVPGVQPKLSLGWIKDELHNGHEGRLTILDALDGHYILKPQNAEYPQMPENEHLTMKLAELFKINVVPFSLIRLASGELCYVTKRIDRNTDDSKNHMIDFLQILELDDKYKGTMENLGKNIGELSENNLLDKLRFFELTIFNYIIGNNDMHLKNYSMFLSDLGWVLSPFYDLLNVKIILPEDKEEMALLLGGKKQKYTKLYFDRFGTTLGLNDKQIKVVYKRLEKWLPKAIPLINQSFLSETLKNDYSDLINNRTKIFFNV